MIARRSDDSALDSWAPRLRPVHLLASGHALTTSPSAEPAETQVAGIPEESRRPVSERRLATD